MKVARRSSTNSAQSTFLPSQSSEMQFAAFDLPPLRLTKPSGSNRRTSVVIPSLRSASIPQTIEADRPTMVLAAYAPTPQQNQQPRRVCGIYGHYDVEENEEVWNDSSTTRSSLDHAQASPTQQGSNRLNRQSIEQREAMP